MDAATLIPLVVLVLSVTVLVCLTFKIASEYRRHLRRKRHREHISRMLDKMCRAAEEASYAMFQEAIKHAHDPKNKREEDKIDKERFPRGSRSRRR